jgi:hypothetical protein
LHDHQELGQTQDEIWKTVHRIGKLSAKFGNGEVFKWAICNDFYFTELFEDKDLFLDVTKKGQLRVLEIASSNMLQWCSREMLEDTAARFDAELLNFILKRKPKEFNLSFTRMCISNGYIEVLEWWKQMELVELFTKALYSEQWGMLDSVYENGYHQAPSHLEEIFKETGGKAELLKMLI